MILLQASDFVGYHLLGLGTSNTSILQDYIDRLEKPILCHLLGVELAELYIADLANVSQDARFVAIEDSFFLQDNKCKIYHSYGIKDLLLTAVLYNFVKDTAAQHAQNGVTTSQNEAQTILNPLQAARFGERKYNTDLIDTAEAIYWYCKTYAPKTFTDPDMLYPEFSGQAFEPVSATFF